MSQYRNALRSNEVILPAYAQDLGTIAGIKLRPKKAMAGP